MTQVAPPPAVTSSLSKSSHNHGLNAARLALVVAGGFAAANAKEVRTEFSVGATVRAVANIELQSSPAAVEISPADLARGYVEIEQPTQLVVRSNSQNGYVLELLTISPMLTSMVVHGLESDLALGAEGGSIVQRWQKPQAVNLSMKFRFVLAPGLKAGMYAWPLQVAVRPLEST
jgi:hypothetical protein